MRPEDWGLVRAGSGRLAWEGHDLVGLADAHGTPLLVASAARLRANARAWKAAFAGYPAEVRLHFSYKTNPVAGILRVLADEGLHAEIVDGWEWALADFVGVAPDRVVFNGPNKRPDELRTAIGGGVGLLVADHLEELDDLERIASELGTEVRLGLRICPDVIPKRMNTSSLTGSRRQPFGLDLPAGELDAALDRVARSPRLRLHALMAHIGSGIHDPPAFQASVGVLLDATLAARRRGLAPAWLDLGGGLGTARSREMTSLEQVAYLGLGRVPHRRASGTDPLGPYAAAVIDAVTSGARARGLEVPGLVLEPGRALTSDAELLLLTVGAVRERPGVGRFVVTDGGAMTVSMMFLSEWHELWLVDRDAPPAGPAQVCGRLPSPMDLVARGWPLPAVRRGDRLAVMDAGAYFTSTATHFGGPQGAVVLLDGPDAAVIRRAETPEDLLRIEQIGPRSR